MRGMFRLVAIALVVAVSAGMVTSALAAVTLNGAGATFPEPLYNRWFYDFNKQTGIKVNYQGIGSGGGIKAIKAGTVNFAGSDAPLSDSDVKAMPGPVVQIPTVGGAVALAYNIPGLNKQLRLSPSTLSAIFLGQIRTWNDPRLMAENPGATLPNRAITVVRRSDGSGTTHIFTTYLAAVSSTWKSQVGAGKEVKWPCGEGGKGNPGVAGLVRTIQGSIGYCELVYAAQNRLTVATVKNRAGRFITPSLASTTAAIKGAKNHLAQDIRTSIVNPSGADAYPICGLTFIFAYKDQKEAATGAALVRLLNWTMTAAAQQTAAAYHYAPLPAELIAICKQKIAAIN